MAQLIPSFSSCERRMTSGERRFARCLEQLLEDDYLCWYETPVGRKRRYPDFIVLHPSRGILFLEIKDWKLDTIVSINRQSVEIQTQTGRKHCANPIEQARQCAYQTIKVLEKDGSLRHCMGRYEGRLSFPYGYGAVFANITRKQLNQAIPEAERESVLPDHLIMCKDEMVQSMDPEVFQTHLWGMFNYRFGGQLTLPQLDRIRGILYPEIRILSDNQCGLFDNESTEDEASLAESLPDVIKVMDIQQEQLARSMGEGHRVIHGVAGSGKTLILGFRCLYFAEILSQPILVLCFNITLAAKLRAFIADKKIESKVQVYHFHDWCGTQLKSYNVDVVKGLRPYWERQVESVIRAVENGFIPSGQYGALLIDEGHDFEPEWLTLVAKMVNPESNNLLLLYDDAQSIYRRKTQLKFTLASVGINARGRTTILKINYRNSREILKFAYEFARNAFSHSDNPDTPIVEPESAGKSSYVPVVKSYSSIAEEAKFIVRCLAKWHRDGRPWSSMALLYPGGNSVQAVIKELGQMGIPFHWAKDSASKKSFDPDADTINVMPIPSSKGLEFETVIVFDASYMRNDQLEDIDLAIKSLYVGLTRAQENLLISCHRENDLSKLLLASSQSA